MNGKVKFSRKALKDLDRRMQKIANGKAEFIPLKEVKNILNAKLSRKAAN
jgi:hypothetical protein